METSQRKARGIGFNHISLEVSDIAAALEFYGALMEFDIEDQTETRASICLGDQFIALTRGRMQPADQDRHFGLVVDDKEAFRRALQERGVPTLPGRFLGFLDPWGNHVEVVGYDNVKFTKAANVLRGMRLSGLCKTEKARNELASKGMWPE